MALSSAVVMWKRSETISRAVGVPVALCRVRPQSLSRRLRVRGGNDESSVGEPVGQLLRGIALSKIELLELISEALQIDRGQHKKRASVGRNEPTTLRTAIQN